MEDEDSLCCDVFLQEKYFKSPSERMRRASMDLFDVDCKEGDPQKYIVEMFPLW